MVLRHSLGGGGEGAGAVGVAISGGSARRREAMKGMKECSEGGGSSRDAFWSPCPSSSAGMCCKIKAKRTSSYLLCHMTIT